MADRTQSDVDFKKLDDQTVVIPEIYFNGIEIGMSLSDLNIILVTNGKRHSRLLMSFTTAKTLVAHLKEAVGELERRTDQKIMTMEDVKKAVERATNKGANK